MSEKLRESLSATMDDEADEFELRRVLDEMEKDASLRDTWERYHLIGSHMRGRSRGGLQARGHDLREQVWAVLDLENSEPAPELAEPQPVVKTDDSVRGPWIGRVTGLAVAATVAFAVVFGIGTFGPDEETAASNAVSAVKFERPDLQEIQLNQEVSASDLQRANAYYLHHVQHQALNQPGVASFVKLVTYERK